MEGLFRHGLSLTLTFATPPGSHFRRKDPRSGNGAFVHYQ